MAIITDPAERTKEAVAWLQQAPDLTMGDYKREDVRTLARCAQIAWGILTEGWFPYSARTPEEKAISLVCPARGSTWRHFKGGVYFVRGPCFIATLDKAGVCYSPYGSDVEYSRTLEDWYAEVPGHGPRFTIRQEDQSPLPEPSPASQQERPAFGSLQDSRQVFVEGILQ